jgi:predicted metal-dependent hydrolase
MATARSRSVELDLGDRRVMCALMKNARAKRIILRASPPGDVAITLPRRVGYDEGLKFAESQIEWIKRRIGAAGDGGSLFGAPLEVIRQDDLFADGVTWRHDEGASRLTILSPANDDTSTDEILERFYERVADEHLPRRARELARLYGATLTRVAVRKQRSRWGSCSSNGAISLNRRLVHFRKPVIDYVIAHELAHLEYLDHSPAFWSVVEKMIPEYRALRRELRGGVGGKS